MEIPPLDLWPFGSLGFLRTLAPQVNITPIWKERVSAYLKVNQWLRGEDIFSMPGATAKVEVKAAQRDEVYTVKISNIWLLKLFSTLFFPVRLLLKSQTTGGKKEKSLIFAANVLQKKTHLKDFWPTQTQWKPLFLEFQSRTVSECVSISRRRADWLKWWWYEIFCSYGLQLRPAWPRPRSRPDIHNRAH